MPNKIPLGQGNQLAPAKRMQAYRRDANRCVRDGWKSRKKTLKEKNASGSRHRADGIGTLPMLAILEAQGNDCKWPYI